MHEVTINLDTLLWIATFIGALCTAVVWFRKGMVPFLRPFKEINELKAHAESCEQRFMNDDRRLDELSADMKEVIKAQLLLMKHAETGNCTGEVAEGREHLQNYLIDKG